MEGALVRLLLPDARHALRRKLGLGLCIGLIGCMIGGCVVPLAPYSGEPRFYGSGRVLTDGVPSFIVVGKTTWAEVLKELGSAEVEAVDGSWLYYESDFLKDAKGVWVLVGVPGGGGAGKMGTATSLLRRLLVRFSGDNVVSSASFRAQECEASGINPDRPPDRSAQDLKSCEILQEGLEMRQQRENQRLAAANPVGDGPAERFDLALWLDGTSKIKDLLGWSIHPSLSCKTTDGGISFEKNRGILAISSRALIFLPKVSVHAGAPPDPLRVPLTDIAAVSQVRATLFPNQLSVDVKRHDGRYVSFTLCKSIAIEGGVSDLQRISAARALLEKRIPRSPEQ